MKTGWTRSFEEHGFNEKSLIATIAQQYHKDNKPQREIAEKCNISQAEVSRYLKMAKQLGIVHIEIDPFFTEDLGTQLKEKFPHLKEAIVVPLIDPPTTHGDLQFLQELGMEGARYFLRVVDHTTKIGVSCGNTVEMTIHALGRLFDEGAPAPVACQVNALIIPMTPHVWSVTPPALVANLVSRLPGSRGKAFQLPSAMEGQDGKAHIAELYRRTPEICELLSENAHLDCYLIGVGPVDYRGSRGVSGTRNAAGLDFNSLIWERKLTGILKEQRAVGEALFQPFDRNGGFLVDTEELDALRNCVLYLRLEVLRAHVENKTADVIAVAGGKLKHEAIYAALRTRIFNVLVTDSMTAGYVLAQEQTS